MTRRISLLSAALAAVCALPAVAAAPPKPDLDVRIADPVPTGQAGSYGIRLKATVVNDGHGRAHASQLRFALSQNRHLGEADTLLPLVRTDALAPGRSDAATQEWQVPDGMDAGIYHVIACADAGDRVAERDESDNCRVAEETVAVTEPSGSTDDQAGAPAPGALAGTSSPKPEHFPESTLGMTVSAPLDCPASLHGQGKGRCVWVDTGRWNWDWQHPDDGRIRSDFWYCPEGYGYPFEVALGFDPMWENNGFNSDAFVETVAKKRWTLYRNWVGREYYPSYGAPSDRRGYLSIDFNGAGRGLFSANPWAHQASYLCSDTVATSMLP
jgi:hypothetical protein